MTATDSNDLTTARVRFMMKRNRQRQEDLAAVLGLSRQSVSAKLSGRATWNMRDLDRLSDLWGIPRAAFLIPTDEVHVTHGNHAVIHAQNDHAA